MVDPRHSKLPQEPEYWDGLAAKINDDAAATLASYAAASTDVHREDDWTAVLGRSAPWLVAASLAAMLVMWLILPPRPPSPAFVWLGDSLAPSEVAGSLVAGSTPPSVEQLMAQFPPAGEETPR